MGHGCEAKQGENEMSFKGRTCKWTQKHFKLGLGKRTKVNDDLYLTLKAYETRGFYISPVIKTQGFKALMLTWHGFTPAGSDIEVQVQVLQDTTWSEWFTYGKWSSYGNRGSQSGQRDPIAYLDIDTIQVIGKGEVNGLRYRIDFRRDHGQVESPQVRSLIATLALTERDKHIEPANSMWQGELDVPERSQMGIPEIGNIICSPTSLAMVMDYYGYNLETKDVAMGVYDHGADIYGNWSYNVAFAGSKGLDAYIDDFASMEEIKEKLAEGIPVIASIMTKSKEDLIGAPMAYPSGHLLVVRGFKVTDGVDYVIVNDPAAPDHRTVRRNYRVDQFAQAWRGIVYILKPMEE